MTTFTYKTPRCERMFRDTPFVGCTCIDCRLINARRTLRRWVGNLIGACFMCASPWHRASCDSPGAILTGTTGCPTHDGLQRKNVRSVGKSD